MGLVFELLDVLMTNIQPSKREFELFIVLSLENLCSNLQNEMSRYCNQILPRKTGLYVVQSICGHVKCNISHISRRR